VFTADVRSPKSKSASIRRFDASPHSRLDAGIELAIVKAHLPLRETLTAVGGDLAGCRRFSQLADAVATFKAESSEAAQ
jgi:hypothetical protein